MANNFLDDNGLLYFWQKIKNIFATKTELNNSKTTVEDSLTSTSTVNALSANKGKELSDRINAINGNMENLGAGDMLKSKYDVDNNGQVDKADDSDKLGGQSPEHYATAESLNNFVLNSKVGQANGVASLGADGKVPESQLPETAPIEHTHEISEVNGLQNALNGKAESEHGHEMSDIEGLDEGVAQMTEALNNKADKVHTHEISEVNGLQNELDEMVAVAQGKCASFVFDTVEDLDTWLSNTENTANLKTGDIFYIRAVNVPDYWWDKETSSKQILETTKVDLSTISNAEIDTIVAS